MKLLRNLLAVLFAACVFTVVTHAADASGTWKWTSVSKTGGAAEVTAVIVVKDGVVTGTVTGRQGPAPIADGSLKDGVISFTVTRVAPGGQSVFKYDGKVEGNSITGNVERPGPVKDGPPIKTTWKATRAD